jgi:hypothetical protein
MKNERIIVFTIIIDVPTMKTVGTKYSWWKGSIGSKTEPAELDRVTLIPGWIIKSTIIPRSRSIGIIIDDIASAWASPPESAGAIFQRYMELRITLL